MEQSIAGLTPDLLSLVVQLQPLAAVEAEARPQWWGRAAHALLLRLVQAVDPNLAADLHEGDDLRPFTASNLLGAPSNRRLQPHARYTLRFTACSAALTQALLQAARNGPLAPGQTVELDGVHFRVQALEPAAAFDPGQPTPLPVGRHNDPPPTAGAEPAASAESAANAHPQSELAGPSTADSLPANGWAALHSYQALSAPYLLSRQEAPRRLTLQLASPTGFRSNGRQIPLPLPGLVFGSLLERWNAFAPIAFPPEARRYAEECLVINRFELRSHGIPTKGGGIRLGAVGVVSYSSLNYDRYWMSVCAILADFALFAGVGAGVSQGLGQCRRLPEAAAYRGSAALDR